MHRFPELVDPKNPKFVDPKNPKNPKLVDPKNPKFVDPNNPKNPKLVDPKNPKFVDPKNPKNPKLADPKNPKNSKLVDPKNPKFVDPKNANNSKLVDPKNPKNPNLVDPKNPKNPKLVDPKNPKFVDPKNPKLVDPKNPKNSKLVDPKISKLVDPKNSKLVDPKNPKNSKLDPKRTRLGPCFPTSPPVWPRSWWASWPWACWAPGPRPGRPPPPQAQRRSRPPEEPVAEESAESKVERLGQAFRRSVRQLREKSSCLDLVFLVDESSSVGAGNFRSELRFVRKTLSDFPVAPSSTRVALVTFSSKSHVVTRVDHISAPAAHQHKCSLFNQEIPGISYRGGGTYTKGAFQRAAQILRQSRGNATRVIFLITDGYSNGGDPRPVAAALRGRGVEIFTLGIWQGNIRELHDMASPPKDQHCFLLHNFNEFEALARRALHEDLPSGSYIQDEPSRCSWLCEAGRDCCDLMASCKCGTHTGQYDCVCEKGHYGKGLQHECTACPPGTYKPEGAPGGPSTCLSCPDPQHTSQPGSTSLDDCVCKPGYRAEGPTCQAVLCPPLAPPPNGVFVQNVCLRHFEAACGVRCLPGFQLQGPAARLCQGDGTWSGTPPTCTALSCPLLARPLNGFLRCSDGGASFRTRCQVGCDRGFRLEGDATLTCLADSQWSGAPPTCLEVRCPPIAPPPNVLLTPPACGRRPVAPGAHCLLGCRQGYSLQGNRKAACLGSGNWTANVHKAVCTDTEPPSIRCPPDIVMETAERRGTAVVIWDVPEPEDNSGEEVAVQVKPVYSPPQLLPIGRETITYIASDRAGNRANCSLTVSVIDSEPPVIDRCRSPPPVRAADGGTPVVWETPQFSDNSGARLSVVSSHRPGWLFPVGQTLVQYTATDAHGNSRTCNITVTVQGTACEQPYVPVNGAFECGETAGGVRCRLSCRPGFSLTQDAASSYFCANDGVWEPPPAPSRPDCSVNRVANNGLKPFEMLFKASRCDDADLLKSFAGDFGARLGGMLPNICSGDDVTCKLEVMSQGHCLEYNYDYDNGFSIAPGGWSQSWGPQGSQDYAYFESGFATGSRPLPSMQRGAAVEPRQRSKRHRTISGPTRDQKIQIYFNITASIPLPLARNDSVEVANQKRLLRTLELLTNRLKRTLAKQPLSSFQVSSQMLVADPKSLEGRRASLFCRPGSVLKGRMCVQCPVGTYFSLEHGECESCWLGSFQDQEGQLECRSCPEGTSTAYLHSRSPAECKGQCKPGSHSLNGLEICESCPLGHFQPAFGARECLLCPGETSTVTRGAVDPAECGVPCAAGHFSRTGLVPCYPCPRDYYQPEHGRSYCLSCPFYGTTTVTGATSIQHCSSFGSSFLPKEESVTAAPEVEVSQDYQASSQVFHECFLNPCQNKGTCEEVGAGYVCTCAAGFTGAKCEVDINECDSAPCQNGGLCQDGMGSFQCQCQPGFMGSLCQAEVNECVSSPCLNDGVCVDEVAGFACSCAAGFTGSRCELELDECLSGPCLNGGVCEDQAGGFGCACAPGFSGPRCQVDSDECLSAPCLHGGSCRDGVNSFRCGCVRGFRGRLCEVDVDECDPNPCENGASCLDGPGAFACRCLPGFNGTRCETEMSSAFNLDFEVSGIHGYVMMDGAMPALTEITCTFWMRSSDTTNYGTPLSYAVEGSDNAFLLIDYNGWVLYVNGKERITDCPAVNTGQWQHIGVSWRSWDGDWRIFINGKPSDGGKGLSVGTTIPGGGALVLGQEQDKRGEGFNPVESFVGSISQLNIWDRVLTPQQIKVLASSCPSSHVTHRGNVLAWPDFLSGVVGRVRVNLSSIFCADCPRLQDAAPHLHVSSVEVGPGAQVQLSCDPGFYLVGEPLLQCQNKGEWSHPVPKCQRVSCGPPLPLENGLFRGEDFQAGGSVEYECDAGFYLLGDARLLCGNSGQWGGHPPACLDVDECALGSDCDPHARCQNTEGSYSCSCTPPYTGDGKNCTEPVRCPDPGAPEFGHRAGSSFLVGGEVAFGCEVGYELTGSSRLLCLDPGTWNDSLPFCRALSCPEPLVPENSTMTGTNFTYGSKVTFSCKEGFLPRVPYEFQCLSSLRWSGAPPACHPLTCGGPPPVEHAQSAFHTDTYLSTATYTCAQGYRPQGSVEVVCEASGEWSRPPPRCVSVLCSPPPELKDAVVVGEGQEVGSKVHYVCKEGYTLIGPETRECLPSGAWSSGFLQCVPRSCGPPPAVEHAVPHDTHKLFGDTATYYCTDGYAAAANNSRLLCTARGEWAPPAGEETPRCIAAFCLRPPDPPHAILDAAIVKPKYPSGTEVAFKCQEGFQLEAKGGGVVRCMMGGVWDPDPARVGCTPVRCAPPDAIERGYVRGADFSFGAVVAYSCEPGFLIRGDKRRTCRADGRWGGPPPACVPVTCPAPPPLKNGYIRVRGRYTFSSRVTYACNAGFQLLGRAERECQANRQWSAAPSCVLLRCPPPPPLPNGLHRGADYQVGRKVSYSCLEGFELSGDAVWTCQKDGRWEPGRAPGRAPFCSPARCPEPPLEARRLVLRALDAAAGTVELSCEEGYVLRGARFLRCTPSREWNATFPECRPALCGPPPEVAFATAVAGDDAATPDADSDSDGSPAFPVGATVTYACMSGFSLRPGAAATASCMASGAWSSPLPECAAAECPQPAEVADGVVDVQGLAYLSRAQYSCRPGFRLLGNATMLCGERGQWLGAAPTCRPVECPPPAEIPAGSVAYTKLQFGHSATYSCRRGYRLQGAGTVGCRADGEWDGAPPACLPISCPPPRPLASGFVEGRDHGFGATIFYSCFPGYQLAGADHLTCEEAGWSGAAPACVRSDCGLPPHIDFGDYRRVSESTDGARQNGARMDGVQPDGVQQDGAQMDGAWQNGARLDGVQQNGAQTDGAQTDGAQTDGARKDDARQDGARQDGAQQNGARIRQDGARMDGVQPDGVQQDGTQPDGAQPDLSFLHGSLIEYRCHRGYELTRPTLLACQEDGAWNGTAPLCVPVACEPPPRPAHGGLNLTAAPPVAVATYWCEDGYELNGERERRCVAGRRWSGAAPVCRPRDCGDPGAVGNATATGGDFSYPGAVHYECHAGFVLRGADTIGCQADGRWSGPPPRCDIISCDPPADISHGYVNGSSFAVGAAVEYVCFQGYRVSGDPVLRCTPSGAWAGAVPTCEPCVCTPPQLRHGAVLAGGELGGHLGGGELGGVLGGGGELTDGVLGGGAVLRGVERGGVLGGGELGDGELGGHLGGGLLGGDGVLGGHLGGGKLGGGERGSVPGDGKLDGDGVLGDGVMGGHLGGGVLGDDGVLGGHLGGGELPCGTALRFRCDDGFRLLGPAHAVCGAGGLWAPGVPLCARGRCGDAPPPAVANGVLQGGAIGGGGLLYRCRPGFRPRGSPLVACGRDGRWAEPRLSCEAASCGRPPEVANATATGDAFTFPNQVTYRCDDGYELATPSSSLSCQSDGTWSRLTVACRPAPCRLPNATDPRVVVSGGGLTPVGGALTPVGGALTPVGGRVALSCPPGFSLKGPALAECQVGGAWAPSISSASCVAAGCDKPRPLLHGLMEGDRFGFGDAVRFSCLPGFLLKGDSTQTCQEDKTWSGTRPVCVEAGGCLPPPLLMHGSVHEHSLSTGRALEFQCQPGYSLMGEQLVVCMGGAAWSSAFPSCQRVSCGPPLHVANGVVRGAVFQFGDQAVYSCFGGFVMEGVGRSRCQENGTWTPPPTCRAACWLPCQNGGVCQRPNVCSCPEGWMGRLCEDPICILPCLNGGRCVAPYSCECLPGWTGSRCHSAVCSTACQNGGRCIRPNRCSCSPGWSGHNCSRKRKSVYYHF
ncbi:LOW QUALITY PROTEIN: sushi, von Willebrand factor type A, EGF and pentraxin domain-containing protein 1 [Menidia menidia]